MAIPDGKPATDFSAMNREWVRAVASEAAGGGLPEITEADEGKVLTVESGEAAWAEGGGGIPAPAAPSNGDVLTYDSTNGEWVAAAPSGGGGEVILVHYYFDNNTEQFISCSMTPEEIHAAESANKSVLANIAYLDQNNNDVMPAFETLVLINSEYEDANNFLFQYNYTYGQMETPQSGPPGMRFFSIELDHDETGVSLGGGQAFIETT